MLPHLSVCVCVRVCACVRVCVYVCVCALLLVRDACNGPRPAPSAGAAVAYETRGGVTCLVRRSRSGPGGGRAVTCVWCGRCDRDLGRPGSYAGPDRDGESAARSLWYVHTVVGAHDLTRRVESSDTTLLVSRRRGGDARATATPR